MGHGIVKFAASLLVVAAFAAVPAQTQAVSAVQAQKMGVVVKKPKKVTAPKPKCAISRIGYDSKAMLVSASGRCFVPKYKGHKLQKLPAKWSFVWTGYDSSGTTFGAGSKGAGKGVSFPLNPARFDHVSVTFTVISPKAKKRPKAVGAKTQVIQLGGVGLIGPGLGNDPGTTPPPVVNGVNPLCPFNDPFVDSYSRGNAQCGTAVPGSGAFVTPPTLGSDGTVQSGTWLTPAGRCVAPPNVAKGPYDWFGYDVFLVTGYACDGGLFSSFGVATITLVNPDGSSCTLHPDGIGVVATFRVRPEWSGKLRVTFIGYSADRSTGKPWPPEYETHEFSLSGSQNGCISPDWKIQSIQ